MDLKPLGRTGVSVPALGLGTWGMGGGTRRDSLNDDSSVSALEYGLELGMNLIDTAEMYGGGHCEEVVARAIARRREQVFLATKVSPQHFNYENVLRSAKLSLERLKVSQVELYQLHWPNPSVPISETMRAMEKLVQDGFVKHIGVSNFSVEQVEQAQSHLSKQEIVSNQVEYSLLDRSPERDGVLEQCEKMRIALIAYSPLGQGRLFNGKGNEFETLDKIAMAHRKSRAQVALNWLLLKKPVIAIPKAGSISHVKENADSMGWHLSASEMEELDLAFD